MSTLALLETYRRAGLSLKNMYWNGGNGPLIYVDNPLYKPANNPWTGLSDQDANPILTFTGQQAGGGTTADQYHAAVQKFSHKPDAYEFCTWGEGFLDIDQAAVSDDYCKEFVRKYGKVCVISHHLETELIFQNPINVETFGPIASSLFDGISQSEGPLGPSDVETVQKRAIERAKVAALAAGRMSRLQNIPVVVVGFTGSDCFHLVHRFPNPMETFRRSLKRWGEVWLNEILPVYESQGVCFALESHPGEMTFDLPSAVACLEAVNYHPNFGFNIDPSHPQWMGANPAVMAFLLGDRVFYVHGKGSVVDLQGGLGSLLNGYINFDHPLSTWKFEGMGLGNIPVITFFAALKMINYRGPVSAEWESVTRDWPEAQDLMVHVMKVALHGSPPSGAFNAFQN